MSSKYTAQCPHCNKTFRNHKGVTAHLINKQCEKRK